MTSEERLLDRIEEVCRIKGWSLREWAREAKLKEVTHLHTITRALRNADQRVRKRHRSIGNVETWVKLADAAGVSLEWLVLGRGSPYGLRVQVNHDPAYPSRAKVIAAAYGMDVPESVIRALMEQRPSGRDPGAGYWLSLLLAEISRQTPGPNQGMK